VSAGIVNEIVSRSPASEGKISFFRLGAVQALGLRELHSRAERLALSLRALGLERGRRIGILAGNCLEWVLLDLAALRLGAVTVGFDPARFDLDPALVQRYELTLLFSDRAGEAPGIWSTQEVAALIDRAAPNEAPEPIAYSPDDVTTLKLTSGSTGEPKAMTASVASIDSSLHAVQEMFGHGVGDNLFVFLPLSLLQQRYWVYSALRFGHDLSVSTYEAAFPALGLARPTVVMGVPAFYDAAKAHIEARARRAADGTGSSDALRAAGRDLFGDRIRYLWTGSAPARGELISFFTDIGLPMYEGYGLNETCIVSKNHPGANRPGSVGRVLPGKRVLFDGDGVISVHSEYPVTRGYELAPPGASERVFVGGGVVRTGDLGYLDEDGFLFIRGRADDVIVLENGRKIVVRPIEEHMKASAAIEECVLFCPTQAHLVAVVSPAQNPADVAAIAERVALTNACVGRDEQIKRVVVARRFTVEDDLLTSQLKPKRKRILEAYRSEIHNPEGGIIAA
jgi:long-subunit acyl-CoA synthetase (AMP-forming)